MLLLNDTTRSMQNCVHPCLALPSQPPSRQPPLARADDTVIRELTARDAHARARRDSDDAVLRRVVQRASMLSI